MSPAFLHSFLLFQDFRNKLNVFENLKMFNIFVCTFWQAQWLQLKKIWDYGYKLFKKVWHVIFEWLEFITTWCCKICANCDTPCKNRGHNGYFKQYFFNCFIHLGLSERKFIKLIIYLQLNSIRKVFICLKVNKRTKKFFSETQDWN